MPKDIWDELESFTDNEEDLSDLPDFDAIKRFVTLKDPLHKDSVELTEMEKLEKNKGYNGKYYEENKHALQEKQKVIFEDAYNTLNGKSQKMQVANVLTYTGVLAPVGIILNHQFKQNAQDTLLQEKAKRKVIEEQIKDNEERQANLEAENLKRESEKKVSAPQDTSPTDNDLEAKEYSGGRGVDVMHHSQVMAKANDEITLSDFKKQVIEKHKANLNRDLIEYENIIKQYEKDREPFIQIARDAGYSKTEVNNLLVWEEELEKLNKEIAEKKTAYQQREERLKQIPGDGGAYLADIKKWEKKLANGEKKFNQLKDLTSEVKAQKESLESKIKASEEQLKKLEKQSPTYAQEKTKLERTIRLNQISLKNATTAYEKANSQYLPMEKNRKRLETNIKGAKTQVDKLLKQGGEYKKKNPELLKEIGELTKLQKALKDAVNNNKRMPGYDRLISSYKAARQVQKNIEQAKADLKTVEKDVLEARSDKAMTQFGYHGGIRCICVGTHLYLDEKDWKEKGHLNEPKINETERARLITTQKLVKHLKNNPVFKYLNSDNLAEYMTYNEKTGHFDLYNGSLEDSTKRELYNAQKRSEYFKDDILFDTHLIETDKGRYIRNAIGDKIAESWKKTKNFFSKAVDNPLEFGGDLIMGGYDLTMKGNKFADFFDGAIGKDKTLDKIDKYKKDIEGVYKLNQSLEKSENDDVHTSDVNIMNQFALIPKAIQLCFSAIGKISNPDIMKTSALSDAITDLSFIQSIQKVKTVSKSFKMDMTGLSGCVTNIFSSVVDIVKSVEEKKGFSKEHMDQLELGHKRFARIVEQGRITAKESEINKIISLSADITKQAFMMAAGFTGPLVDLAADGVKSAAQSIAKAIQENKRVKNIIYSPEIIGGLDINKKALSEKDVQQVMREVTGIQDFKSIASMVHVTDAIDMHRTLKAERENTNLPGVLRALGFNAGAVDSISVNSILEKVSGSNADFKTRIRDAIESPNIAHMSVFKKFWKSLTGGIKQRFRNLRKGHIEATYEKQREQLVKKYGKDGALQYDAAMILFDAYQQKIQQGISEGKKLEDMNHIKMFSRQDMLVGVFAMTDAAKELRNPKHYQNGELKPGLMDQFLEKAINQGNDLIKDAQKSMNQKKVQAEKQKQALENKDAKPKKTKPTV